MLYDSEFIQGLPEPQDAWKAPLVAYVAKAITDKHASLKDFLENWYDKLPNDQKPNYYSRLRSLDDKVFIAQVNEFLVADICSAYGEVEFNPTLNNGQTPELIWTLGGYEGLLDVVTIFESEEVGQSEDAIDRLLNYLGEIEHFFNVSLWYQSIDSNSLKPSSIKKRLVQYLDSIDPTLIDPDEELIIEEDGLFGGFYIFPKEDITSKTKLNFALMGPARKIDPLKAIEKRIKSKLRKYKWEGPIFVAICKAADSGVDWDDVAEIMYGPTLIDYNPITKEHINVLGGGGLVMSRGGNAPLNTSLTGILHCEQDWSGTLPTLKAKYLINPFARFPIEISLPSYPIVRDGKIKFLWSNTNKELGHH